MTVSFLTRQARWLNHKRCGPLGPLVLFTDDQRLPDPRAYLAKLPRGGSVILRSKSQIDPKFALAVLKQTRSIGLCLLIAGDDRLAQEIHADGVHVPSKDLNRLPALQTRFPHFLFTAACHTGHDLRLANRLDADAAFLSPLFSTRSHLGAASLSPMQVRDLAAQSHIPIYGLGGINIKTAQRARAMPLCGFGMIDGFLGD